MRTQKHLQPKKSVFLSSPFLWFLSLVWVWLCLHEKFRNMVREDWAWGSGGLSQPDVTGKVERSLALLDPTDSPRCPMLWPCPFVFPV